MCYTFNSVLGENVIVVVNVYIFEPTFRSLAYSRQILKRGSFSLSIILLLIKRKKASQKRVQVLL